MSILNGLRKAFTTTPPVPTVPGHTPTAQQEIEFLNGYRAFAAEIDRYKATKNYDNVPGYYKELRKEQYEDFKKEVADFVRGATNEKFRNKVLEVDGSIALHLLDHKDCLKQILKVAPVVIRILPQSHQEDPELAEVILEHNVGKIKHLPLKFRNDPGFMYRCLADESKFEPVGPFPAKSNRHEILTALGTELRAKLDMSESRKVPPQLKALADAESQARLIGQGLMKESKGPSLFSRMHS